MKLIKLECTCEACPTQYDGKLDDGRMIYVRYRWGYLSIRISKDETDDIFHAVRGEEIYGICIGNGLDGWMEYSDIIDHLEKAGIVFKEFQSIHE